MRKSIWMIAAVGILAILLVSGCKSAGDAPAAGEPMEVVQDPEGPAEPPMGEDFAEAPGDETGEDTGEDFAGEDTSATDPAPGYDENTEVGRVMKLLEIEKMAKDQTAESYFLAGKACYDRMWYRKAANYFKQAFNAGPDEPKYKEWYFRTLWILGDRKGEIYDVARTLINERQVRIHQATVEMERLFVEAYRLFQDRKYDKAIEKFETVLETIKWFPFIIDQKKFEDKTKHWINLARLKSIQQERRKKELEREAARQTAEAEKATNLQAYNLRIRSILKQAKIAFDKKRWDKCERLANRVLLMEPNHEKALKLREEAIAYRHRTVQTKIINDYNIAIERQLDFVDRSAVPYQFILDYPEEEKWLKICQRRIPIEETIQKDESPDEIRIKNKLENQKVTLKFTDTPFVDAVNFLRDITGLNFVITTDAMDIIDNEELRVNLRIREVKLKDALNLVLGAHSDLKYRIKNGVIYITTAEVEGEELFLEFYNVLEIINEVPDFPAPIIALRDWGGTQGSPGHWGSGGAGGGAPVLDLDDDDDESQVGVGFGPDALQELVVKIAAADDDEGIELHGGILVVRKPLEVHRKIQKLLAMLRKTVGIMVTVEARFVDIRDNFLEEVGVDFTDLDTNVPNTITGDHAAGFTYRMNDPQMDLRGALINRFSQPMNVLSFPFNITNEGGSAIQFNMLEDFQIEALFDAVQKKQKAHLLNAPRITVFNTQRSHLCAIYQRAYIEDLELNTSSPIPVLNPVIGILHYGSVLEARPVVSYDKNYVAIEVKPTLATMNQPRYQPVTLAMGYTVVAIELPYLTVQKVRSTVLVPDGGMIVVGGMKDLREFKQTATVPILGQIPILKFLFQRRGETKLKRSSVVLVRADITILREEEEKRFGFSTYGENW